MFGFGIMFIALFSCFRTWKMIFIKKHWDKSCMIGYFWLKRKPEKKLYIFNENLWKDKGLMTFINKHDFLKKIKF
jgi:hypothetical protein